MGNSNESQSFLKKGEGLRILSIKLNSPFDGKVEPFFDFIIDIIPLQQLNRSPKQILDKLTGQQSSQQLVNKARDFNQIITDNQQKRLQIKIVSTKYRNVRSIQITPNRNWNGSMDLIGISYRKQKFDEVFDSYFPFKNISMNSPVQNAGIQNGQYILGCLEFSYTSINNFLQGLYDRFFDKEIKDKHVRLAVYDMLHDQVKIKPILLKRGWGGSGLLGCQFLQGQMYKFPLNLSQIRQKLRATQKSKVESQKVRVQLKESDGASKTLVQALRSKRGKGKHLQAIKQIISAPIPQIPIPISNSQMKRQDDSGVEGLLHDQSIKIQFLQRRVFYLQQMLGNVQGYVEKLIEGQKEEKEQKEDKEIKKINVEQNVQKEQNTKNQQNVQNITSKKEGKK